MFVSLRRVVVVPFLLIYFLLFYWLGPASWIGRPWISLDPKCDPFHWLGHGGNEADGSVSRFSFVSLFFSFLFFLVSPHPSNSADGRAFFFLFSFFFFTNKGHLEKAPSRESVSEYLFGVSFWSIFLFLYLSTGPPLGPPPPFSFALILVSPREYLAGIFFIFRPITFRPSFLLLHFCDACSFFLFFSLFFF